MSKVLILLLKLLSRLPLRILLFFSDLLFVVLYYLLGYRKQVVRKNLKLSFPTKTDEERLKIEKDFYQFFCDMMFETLKNFSIGSKNIASYLKIQNPEVLNAYAEKKQQVLLVMGHYGNWEFCLSLLNPLLKHQLKVLYKPFKSEVFHEVLAYERRRHGVEIVPMKNALRSMMRTDSTQAAATVFIADQSPSHVDTLWTLFLNQETPIFEGPERIAMKLKIPVVFMSLKREGRARYSLRFEEICQDASKCKKNEISLKHTALLERDIQKEAYPWLWSHKRWKRKRPETIALINDVISS